MADRESRRDEGASAPRLLRPGRGLSVATLLGVFAGAVIVALLRRGIGAILAGRRADRDRGGQAR